MSEPRARGFRKVANERNWKRKLLNSEPGHTCAVDPGSLKNIAVVIRARSTSRESTIEYRATSTIMKVAGFGLGRLEDVAGWFSN
jgi:hypothetical protein